MRRVTQLVKDQNEGAQVGRCVPPKNGSTKPLKSVPKNWMGSINGEMMYKYTIPKHIILIYTYIYIYMYIYICIYMYICI